MYDKRLSLRPLREIRLKIAKSLCWMLLFALQANAALAQNLMDFPRDDSALLMEYDRYSLKLHRPDTTPLLRIFGSGRVQIYFSALSSNPGLYEIQLSDYELTNLFQSIQAGGLHADISEKLAETAEQAKAKQSTEEYSYSSDVTVSVMNFYLKGATQQPVLAENLQATDRLYPGLKNVSAYAQVERRLLELSTGKLGSPVAAAKTLSTRKQP